MPTSKVRSRVPDTDLTKLKIPLAPGEKVQTQFYEQDQMDLGYRDSDSDFEAPKGTSPDLGDVRFENGGVRKDFGLQNVGAAATEVIRDFPKYEYVDPFPPHSRTVKRARIYRNAAGKAEIQFISGGVWGGTQTSLADMNPVNVKAFQILDLLFWADGGRIHGYSETTEPTFQGDDFTNVHAGTAGTGPNGEMIALNEEHQLTLTQAPVDGEVPFYYTFEAESGLGFVTVAFEYWNTTMWIPISQKTYLVTGPRVWDEEIFKLNDPVALGFTLFRLRISLVAPIFVFGTPTFKAAGFGATAPADPKFGAEYNYLPPVATTFDSILGAPGARYAFPFEDRIIAIGGDDNPRRVSWSADGLPREWRIQDDDLAFTGAGEFIIDESITDPADDLLCGGKVADNTAAIVRRKSILRVQETGLLNPAISITDWVDGVGTESPLSLAQVPGGVIFLGHDFMAYYLSGGGAPVPVGGPIRQRLLEDVVDSGLPLVRGQYYHKFQEYWLAIPEQGGGLSAWWILDVGRLLSAKELVWRYKPFVPATICGVTTAVPGYPTPPVDSAPNGGEPEPEELPPSSSEPLALSGEPFEIIYANGHVWVGLILGVSTADPYIEIFNVESQSKVLSISKDLVGEGDKSFGFGGCFHETRNELWWYGTTGVSPSRPVLLVFDGTTFAFLRRHDYASYEASPSVSHAIEVGPDGLLYAGMRHLGGGSPSGIDGTVVQIDPVDGSVLAYGRPPVQGDSILDTIACDFVMDLVWDEDKAYWWASTKVENIYNIHSSDMSSDFISGKVGGLSDTGFTETEMAYNSYDRYVYKVKTMYGNMWRWNGNPGGTNVSLSSPLPVWKSWAGGQSDPKGGAAIFIPAVRGVAVSRGHSGVLFADPNTTGRITIYDTQGNVVRDYITDFHPARLCDCPVEEQLAVLAFWNISEPTYYLQFLSYSAVYVVGDPPSDAPPNEDDPFPTPEPSPDPPAGGDAPTITGARQYCTNSMVDNLDGTWSGTIVAGVEVDYSDGVGHAGQPIEIGVWPAGNGPGGTATFLGPGTVVDADTKRLQTQSATHTNIPDAQRPTCGVGERPGLDQHFDVFIRHDLGGGMFSAWSSKVRVTIKSVAPIVDEPPNNPLPPPTDPTVSPKIGSIDKYCTRWEADGHIEVYNEVRADATSGQPGPTIYPVEMGEWANTDVVGVDPPLRVILTNASVPYIRKFDIFYTTHPDASCQRTVASNCNSSVPPVTRQYAARFVLDAETFGPWGPSVPKTVCHPDP